MTQVKIIDWSLGTLMYQNKDTRSTHHIPATLFAVKTATRTVHVVTSKNKFVKFLNTSIN